MTRQEAPDSRAGDGPVVAPAPASRRGRPSLEGTAGIAFVMELGVALHRFGTPADRLEAAMTGMARHLGLEAQIFSTPTSIMAGFGPLASQRTAVVRIEPGEVNLERLAALDRVAGEVARGKLDVVDGVDRVREIVAAPPRYGPALMVPAGALLSASAARFLGGGWQEVAAGGAIGLVTGALSLAFRRSISGSRLFELCAATAAAAMAHAALVAGMTMSLQVAVLAGLIALVPGLTLTVAMTELATRNLASGTSRMVAAAVVFLQITFGVALADIVMTKVFGAPPVAFGTHLPVWTEPIALLTFVPGAVVMLGAHPRDALPIAVASAAGYYAARIGSGLLGPELGAAIGAFALAAGSNVYARLADRPAMIPLVPGLLLLVPGSMGLRSLSAMLERDVVTGIDTAFAMILVGVSLVAGLLMATASVPPRREL